MVLLLIIAAVGLALVLWGKGVRRERGLTDGRTLDLDGKTLHSARYALAGRPDRVVMEDGIPIPEEWKSGVRPFPSQLSGLETALLKRGLVETAADENHRIVLILTESGRQAIALKNT